MTDDHLPDTVVNRDLSPHPQGFRFFAYNSSQPLTVPTGTTEPVSTTAAPASTTDSTHAKKVATKTSFIRHSPSTTNHFAYKRKTGRELAPLLIDQSSMGGRFHLLDKELFLSSVPGTPPTEAEYAMFRTPELQKGMSERAIYPQLVRPRLANHELPTGSDLGCG